MQTLPGDPLAPVGWSVQSGFLSVDLPEEGGLGAMGAAVGLN